MKHAVVTFLIPLSILYSGCTIEHDKNAKDMSREIIKIVTTTGMIADAAKIVGGTRVNVTGLMGPGVDPHLYKASAGDVTRLSEADIIFYNGLHLEAKLGELLEEMQSRTETIAVSRSINRNLLVSPPSFKGNYDPHIWFDVTLWIQAVETIRDALNMLDPSNNKIYTENASEYIRELQDLHTYVLNRSAEIPPQHRVLITAHDAFNYFGKQYGFKVMGLQGISTEAEAGTSDVQRLADFIAENRIPAIFVESSIPRRTIQALQLAVASRGFNVEIGGELFSDAMGNAGTFEGTFIGMVTHNINTIVDALKK